MDKVLRCDCGHEVRSSEDAELVARAVEHALTVHGVRFSAGQLLALAELVPEPGNASRRRGRDEGGDA